MRSLWKRNLGAPNLIRRSDSCRIRLGTGRRPTFQSDVFYPRLLGDMAPLCSARTGLIALCLKLDRFVQGNGDALALVKVEFCHNYRRAAGAER